ncbi:MAG TPA: flagellar basal body-associated FliL family protein [Gallionella sp.]|nr:flagellar basal body-associated FliL family protein [Gallionella sp.]
MATKSTEPSYNKTVAIIIALLLLLFAVSMMLYQSTKKGGNIMKMFSTGGEDSAKIVSESHPKFVNLGTFTTSMGGEDGAQNMQTSLSLKLTEPGLDEKINASIPEIKHHMNMVLQSKRASELATYEDKEKLAEQLREHVEYVMGFRDVAPPIGAGKANIAPNEPGTRRNGIANVLFTSFIIQY